MRRLQLSERQLLAVLVATVVALAVGKRVAPDLVPVSAEVIPVMIGGWRLSSRSFVVLSVVVVLALAVEVASSPFGRSYLAAVVVLVVLALSWRYLRMREAWGLRASTGIPILLDLRGRIRALGEPPPLTPGWVMARTLRSARDSAFRGDFTLARTDGGIAQAMVVDVSGHGLDVAPGALQVAGAFGGLVDVVEPHDLLAACNEYLCRREWTRDYASAVHVVLDQDSGRARVRSAGHPHPRVRHADGTWQPVEARGPVLGLARGVVFRPVDVGLSPGDTLVMVTDGALDEDDDHPWRTVEEAVDAWLAAGAASGTGTIPVPAFHGDDDQTIVAVSRR